MRTPGLPAQALAIATVLVELVLVELHGPKGNTIYVNPHNITSVRVPAVPGHFGEGTNCLVFMTSGTFISVKETCVYVHDHLMAPYENNDGGQ